MVVLYVCTLMCVVCLCRMRCGMCVLHMSTQCVNILFVLEWDEVPSDDEDLDLKEDETK